jgi:hypothetical protein
MSVQTRASEAARQRAERELAPMLSRLTLIPQNYYVSEGRGRGVKLNAAQLLCSHTIDLLDSCAQCLAGVSRRLAS